MYILTILFSKIKKTTKFYLQNGSLLILTLFFLLLFYNVKKMLVTTRCLFVYSCL